MPDYNNRFREPKYYQMTIVNDDNGAMVGTLRVKPSGVLWKPRVSKNGIRNPY